MFLLLIIVFVDFLWKLLITSFHNAPSDSIWYSAYKYLNPTTIISANSTNDYLTNLVSIGAGVIGVILGLIYTAFVTIVSTKYANINSSINSMIINHPVLNKYFNFLATLTALSIAFQFILAFGYEPTIISTVIFSVLIIFAVTSFITFAKFTQYLSDTKLLVDDLIGSNHEILNKLLLYKDLIETKNSETNFLRRVYYNLNQIELIIKESIAGNSNTSFEGIYHELDDFLLYYLQIKHTISSKENWHVKVQKFKKWDSMTGHEARMYHATGVEIPENVPGYNEIEKRILDLQFIIFKHYIKEPAKVTLLQDKYKYFQVAAYQCEIEIFDYFFNKVEDFILAKIKENDSDFTFRQYLVSMYPFFYSHHIVGFNNSIKILNTNNINKLAKSLHALERTEKTFQFPYYLKKWSDGYSDTLKNEIFIEGRILTPISFTEHSIALNIGYYSQMYVTDVMKKGRERLVAFINRLDNAGYGQEALFVAIETKEIIVKLNLFLENEQTLLNHIGNFPFSEEKDFVFKHQETLQKELLQFQRESIDLVWKLGITAYNQTQVTSDVPDLFGKFYYIITNDIFEILLKQPVDINLITAKIVDYIRINYLFFAVVWERNRGANEYAFSSSLLPIVVDLLDILSTAIVVSKAHNKPEILDSILEYYNKTKLNNEQEIELWRLPMLVLKMSESGIGLFSNRSYDSEHLRETLLSEYLIENGIITKSIEKADFRKSYREIYISSNDDFYMKVLASFFDRDRIEFMKIREIFIEFYLRSRIALLPLNIEETNYGQRLTRNLED
ncbi:MAG TPA: hypothetical protein DIS94_08705 [Bacteroidetes bacterium]|nr:hypothetical protein [Bacteroidota bacterium]